jgi:outer membrane protein assembly factor BamB
MVGLGHSCPVIWEDRIYLTTAVRTEGEQPLKVGLYGDVDSAADATEHQWRVLCLDRHSGRILWEQTAHTGVPKGKRHTKATHANCTPATDGKHLVVCFGSEGLFCYDLGGRQLWKAELGTLDSGWFFNAEYQWGFASSPIIYRDLAIVQCDVGQGSFIAAFRLADGSEAWRTPREEIPSWGTPMIVRGPARDELVTSATKFVRGYDPLTGSELWRLSGQSEITTPTPVFADGLIYIASGYRPTQPIFAVRPGAAGDISLPAGETSSAAVAWSLARNGPYMSTPLVYRGHFYACAHQGLFTCLDAATGKTVYGPLRQKGAYTASPVAADGRLYLTSEEGHVRVVKAGPEFVLLAENELGEACLATPAIVDGAIYFRTEHHLLALGLPR